MSKRRVVNAIVAIVYIVLLLGLAGGLWTAREQALRSAGQTAAQQEWQEWRTEAERQESGEGPVLRRTPRSDEPPTLVLLRDHFATSVSVLLVLSSALYFALALMIRGVLLAPRFEPLREPDD